MRSTIFIYIYTLIPGKFGSRWSTILTVLLRDFQSVRAQKVVIIDRSLAVKKQPQDRQHYTGHMGVCCARAVGLCSARHARVDASRRLQNSRAFHACFVKPAIGVQNRLPTLSERCRSCQLARTSASGAHGRSQGAHPPLRATTWPRMAVLMTRRAACRETGFLRKKKTRWHADF